MATPDSSIDDWDAATTIATGDKIPFYSISETDALKTSKSITYSNFFAGNESGDFTIKNPVHGNDLLLKCENASGVEKVGYNHDPDESIAGAVYLGAAKTTGLRINITDTTNNTLIRCNSGNFWFENTVDGSNIAFFADDAGSTQRTMMTMNPDNLAVEIGHFLTLTDGSELTISSGIVTATKSFHVIDTEGDAASDDLDTINGFALGKILTISAANDARTIVVKDGTGNLAIAGDFSLDNTQDTISFRGTATGWVELCRSNNGA